MQDDKNAITILHPRLNKTYVIEAFCMSNSFVSLGVVFACICLMPQSEAFCDGCIFSCVAGVCVYGPGHDGCKSVYAEACSNYMTGALSNRIFSPISWISACSVH